MHEDFAIVGGEKPALETSEPQPSRDEVEEIEMDLFGPGEAEESPKVPPEDDKYVDHFALDTEPVPSTPKLESKTKSKTIGLRDEGAERSIPIRGKYEI